MAKKYEKCDRCGSFSIRVKGKENLYRCLKCKMEFLVWTIKIRGL